jgi:hypothetical protein
MAQRRAATPARSPRGAASWSASVDGGVASRVATRDVSLPCDEVASRVAIERGRISVEEVASRSAINWHIRDGYRGARIAIDPAIAARGVLSQMAAFASWNSRC